MPSPSVLAPALAGPVACVLLEKLLVGARFPVGSFDRQKNGACVPPQAPYGAPAQRLLCRAPSLGSMPVVISSRTRMGASFSRMPARRTPPCYRPRDPHRSPIGVQVGEATSQTHGCRLSLPPPPHLLMRRALPSDEYSLSMVSAKSRTSLHDDANGGQKVGMSSMPTRRRHHVPEPQQGGWSKSVRSDCPRVPS